MQSTSYSIMAQELKRPKTPPLPPPPIYIDDELGGDVASVVLQFCELPDWLTFSMTCTKMMR